MIKLTGLWNNTSQKGQQYISGNLGNAKIIIFPNNDKSQENAPDWYMCMDQRKPKGQGNGFGPPPAA